MGIVLFTSNRPLERAENLKAVYDAYDGEKEFFHTNPWGAQPDYSTGKYSLLVADELPNDAPGKCICIGHGMAPGKKYGLDQPDPYFRRSDLITYAIASSVDMVPIVAGYCGIAEDQVIPLGCPRTDAYFTEEQAEQPSKCHLYAPTFRAGAWIPDFNRIHWSMPEGHKLMVKPHMVTGKITMWNSFDSIEMVSSAVPSTPYLLKMQTLVTDYSSIMFDAMVLRKPVILFAKDKDRYLADRGMYLPYPKGYSKYFFDDEQEMAECLEDAEWDDSFETTRQLVCGACDGHSVERTLDLIKSVL